MERVGIIGRGRNRMVFPAEVFLQILAGNVSDESIIAMLPVGLGGPRGEGNGDSKPSLPEVKLPERFEFMRSLCPREISGYSTKRKYNYRGFVVGKYIITENLGYGNAAYLFDGSYGDEWLGEVEKTKKAVRSTGGRSFVCRVIHRGNWKKRILERLQLR